MRVNFFIPGEPCAKGRHRTTKTGIVYPDKKTEQFEGYVKMVAGEAMKGKELLKGALSCVMEFVYLRPQSVKKAAFFKTTTPDVDNLVKSILDGLNKVCYDDDKYVCLQVPIKRYAMENEKPGVYVHLQEISHNEERGFYLNFMFKLKAVGLI